MKYDSNEQRWKKKHDMVAYTQRNIRFENGYANKY